ncbi:MAG: UvrB/UvrC motif-containing protein [Planctomycetota bacterium]|nr:UvrB/UvrC motif-containing protein [Planctomycetota bacterium]
MGMKCEVENCDNEATVHLTEIREGKKHETHLCERCAAEKGLPGKAHFTISDLLAGIASQAQAQAQKTRKGGKEPVCPVCSTTLSQFQSSGRFGCPDCYTAFKDDVLGLVEKIHDASQHVGKVPRRVSTDVSLQKDIRQLQLDLKRAVKREDYEKAAALRDQIRQLDERLAAGEEQAPSAAPEDKDAGAAGHGKKKAEGGEKKGGAQPVTEP